MTATPVRRGLGRGMGMLGVGLLLAVLAVGPASAHNGILSADPADGSTVARTPDAVLLSFEDPAVAIGTEVLVTGPDGAAATGPAQLVDATVRQPLVAGAPAGTYTVEWRVTSDDGHPITGRLSFTAQAAGAGAYAGPVQEPAAADPPVWGWLVLAAALLAAAVMLAVRRRRGQATDVTAS